MAVPLLEQVLGKQRAVCGPSHAATLTTMHQLAMAYFAVGRLADSMALHEPLLEARRATLGPHHRSTRWCMQTFGEACEFTGKFDRAEQLYREALKYSQQQPDSLHRRNFVANTLGHLARNYAAQQRYAEAEPLLREAVALNQKEEVRRLSWLSLLGVVLAGQGKFAEAEPLLLQSYDGLAQRTAYMPATQPRWLAEAGERIVRFYEMTNQPEKAHSWREKLPPEKRPPS
jgi:tetratricopeptide (TPR) repeat protein